MKNNMISLRLNDLQYEHLQELKKARNKLQNFEYEYTNADIIRIALSLLYQVEITGEMETTYHPEIAEIQQQKYQEYWKQHKNS